MSDLYNDFDPGAAAWLRELIAGGHIPEGQVDERSILDVEAGDTAGFRRCHWFAGIGGWAEALRLAAWPDAIPVWTGSPPCQPFSAAGKRAGRDDARHLGPAFVDLVRAARPPVLFGEQVASADVFGHAAKPGKRDRGGAPAWAWCDDLFLRLEAAGYAAWALDIPAAGIGAPHIRQRCFFAAVDLRFAPDGLADRNDAGLEGRGQPGRERSAERPAGAGGLAVGLADAAIVGRVGRGASEAGVEPGTVQRPDGLCDAGWLADADGGNASAEREQPGGKHRQQPQDSGTGWLADAKFAGVRPCGSGGSGSQARSLQGAHGERQRLRPHAVAVNDAVGTRPGPADSFWRDADWLFCRDGKWRPTGAGIQPLAHGVSGRVGLLRGAGNAIVPQAAAEAIAIARDTLIDTGIWAALCREYAA